MKLLRSEVFSCGESKGIPCGDGLEIRRISDTIIIHYSSFIFHYSFIPRPGGLVHHFAFCISHFAFHLAPHPPQCAHWGTFPQGKALRFALCILHSLSPLIRPGGSLCGGCRKIFVYILPKVCYTRKTVCWEWADPARVFIYIYIEMWAFCVPSCDTGQVWQASGRLLFALYF